MQREMSFACGIAASKPYGISPARVGGTGAPIIYPSQPLINDSALIRMREANHMRHWMQRDEAVIRNGYSPSSRKECDRSPLSTYRPKPDSNEPVKADYLNLASPNSVSSSDHHSSDSSGHSAAKKRKAELSVLEGRCAIQSSPIQNGVRFPESIPKPPNPLTGTHGLKPEICNPLLANKLHTLYSMLPDNDAQRIGGLLKSNDGNGLQADPSRITYQECSDLQCPLNPAQAIQRSPIGIGIGSSPAPYNKLLKGESQGAENWFYNFPLQAYNASISNLFKYPTMGGNTVGFSGFPVPHAPTASDIQLRNNLMRLSNLVYARNMAHAAQDPSASQLSSPKPQALAPFPSPTHVNAGAKGHRKSARKTSGKDKTPRTSAPCVDDGHTNQQKHGKSATKHPQVKNDSGNAVSPEGYGRLKISAERATPPCEAVVSKPYEVSRESLKVPRAQYDSPYPFVQVFGNYAPSPPRKSKITPFTVQSIIGRANA